MYTACILRGVEAPFILKLRSSTRGGGNKLEEDEPPKPESIGQAYPSLGQVRFKFAAPTFFPSLSSPSFFFRTALNSRMLWLSLDLVSHFPSLSLHSVEGNTLTLIKAVTSEQRGGLEWTIPHLESLLKTTGHTLPQIDHWFLPEGPGSFTGLRIGAATVKGLITVHPRPVTVISSLEARLLAFGKRAVAVYRVGKDQYAVGHKANGKWQSQVVSEKELPAIAAGNPILIDGGAQLTIAGTQLFELNAKQLAEAFGHSQTATTLQTPAEWMPFQPSYWGDTRFGG